MGDLLVSFTKDQDVLDEALPDALYYAGIYGLILLATTITVSTIIPLFCALTGGLFLVSGIMLALYMPAATHLKKLRMDSSGAVVTLVAEALDGLSTIQAFNQQNYFVSETAKRVDQNHRALFAAETLNLWLAFFCDFYGACLILAVGCFAMAQWETLGSGNVGLAFSQSIQMLVFYTWSVRLLADSIGLFGSAEKVRGVFNDNTHAVVYTMSHRWAGWPTTSPKRAASCSPPRSTARSPRASTASPMAAAATSSLLCLCQLSTTSRSRAHGPAAARSRLRAW